MRDLKRHTSEMLHLHIQKHPQESRREWILWMLERAGKKNNTKFQLWQPESHPVELSTQKICFQKLDYIHYNPVAAGFVKYPVHWLYSSATDYNGGQGLLDIIQLDPMIITI